MSENIEDQAAVIYAIAKNNGFWDEKVDIHFLLSKLALMHSEISEILEALRKQQGEQAVLDELADVYIRLLDFYMGAKQSGWLSENANLDSAVVQKVKKNAERPHKHGNLA